MPTMRAIASPRDGKTPSAAYDAAAPIGIGHDRAAADLVHGDALRVERAGGGDWNDAGDELGVPRRPLERLEATDRATDGDQLADAEALDQRSLRVDDVADGDEREAHAVGAAGERIIEAGPVVPWQPPRMLAQMTNAWSVSSARPGPISGSHQPPGQPRGCRR